MVEVSPRDYSRLIDKAESEGVNRIEAVFVKRGLKSYDRGILVAKANKARAERVVAEKSQVAAATRDGAIKKAKLTRKIGAKDKLRALHLKRAQGIISSADRGILEAKEHRASLIAEAQRKRNTERRTQAVVSSYRRDKALA